MKFRAACIVGYLMLLIAGTVRAQSGLKIQPGVFDFGTVARWKNDTAAFMVEHTGTADFRFLPIAYREDIKVILPKDIIHPGQRVSVKVIYYTENRGFFRVEVPVYISTAANPFLLTLKGKITDFHPDALLNCPTLTDDKPSKKMTEPVEIKVVDAISGKGLTGYNMLLKNESERFLIEYASKDRVYFDVIKDGKYAVSVNLEGYTASETEIYVHRLSRSFVIKLLPDEEWVARKEKEETESRPEDPMIIDKPEEEENQSVEIEKLRQMFNERFKGKRIIEKDVILVKDRDKDSLTVDTMGTPLTDLPDFESDGTLNRRKFSGNNIVFLIDVSGSMDKSEKLPYLKKAVKEMIKVLRKEDMVTIITYAGKVKVVTSGVPGSSKEMLNGVIDGLEAKGQSYGSEGLQMAYKEASGNNIPGGNNQVILVSDGLFNSPDFSPRLLYKMARSHAKDQGIITSCIGFGKDEDAIAFMKNLSQNGLGNFLQIRTEADAGQVLVGEIMRQSAIQ